MTGISDGIQPTSNEPETSGSQPVTHMEQKWINTQIHSMFLSYLLTSHAQRFHFFLECLTTDVSKSLSNARLKKRCAKLFQVF